jgi:hypothetical protein
VKVSRITKIAGLSLAGFVAASVVADKVPLSSGMSQLAGFAGAFLGTLAGRRKTVVASTQDERQPQDKPPRLSR